MKLFSAIFIFIVFNTLSHSQRVNNELCNGMGIGFNVTQIQKDFGLGLNFVSPYFLEKKMAIRIRGNFMFNENSQESLVMWTPYTNISFGFIGVAGIISEKIRLYGEVGTICLLPSNELSNEDLIFGGYGLLGFEFFLNNGFNYYLEIGGVGSGARAEKIIYKPIYSNGFLIGSGFRVFLNHDFYSNNSKIL